LKYSLSSLEFSKTLRASKSLCFGDLSFKYTKSKGPEIGFIVSKKYGNATERCLFKRRCRFVFKSIMVDNNISYTVIVQPNVPGVTFMAIQESFNSIYDKFAD